MRETAEHGVAPGFFVEMKRLRSNFARFFDILRKKRERSQLAAITDLDVFEIWHVSSLLHTGRRAAQHHQRQRRDHQRLSRRIAHVVLDVNEAHVGTAFGFTRGDHVDPIS